MWYVFNNALKSATTASGLNGGRNSLTASRIATLFSRCAIANVIASDPPPPLGSQNAEYWILETGGNSKRPSITTASTASLAMNCSTSVLNNAPYSADAFAG